MSDIPDALRDMQEIEREYTRLKTELHRVTMELHLEPKGTPRRKDLSVELHDLHRLLSAQKAAVNNARARWGLVNQQQALDSMGADASLTSAMRAMTKRTGQLERVFLMACRHFDEPSEQSLRMLEAAVRKARS